MDINAAVSLMIFHQHHNHHKHAHNEDCMNEATRLMRLCTYFSAAATVIMIILKLFAWFLTDSVAVLSSLADSILDGVTALIAIVAVRHATVPADLEHRFGHGKAEGLAGLLQSIIVAASGLFLLFEAVKRLINPVALIHSNLGIAVMIATIILISALVLLQSYVIKQTASLAIAGDRLHHIGDLGANIGVLLALIITKITGWVIIDGIFAALVAVYIIYGAWNISKNALDVLMDRELPDKERALIREIATKPLEVIAMHDLKTRRAGLITFIQLHLEFDDAMTLRQVHGISMGVEAELRRAFPRSEIIIHEDPVSALENRDYSL